jgi:hypothetical protein
LVRVIACAPVPRIATSRVSLPLQFYYACPYCQTRAATTTQTRRGNLNLNLDLTRNANPCLHLNSHSVSLNLCCDCYQGGVDSIDCTFFCIRTIAALHISRSATCRAAGKGVKTVTQEYKPSKRVEDQEAGPVGGVETLPVRPADPGMAYNTRYRQML